MNLEARVPFLGNHMPNSLVEQIQSNSAIAPVVWKNIQSVDLFLQELYDFYRGDGFYPIVATKFLFFLSFPFLLFVAHSVWFCVDFAVFFRESSDTVVLWKGFQSISKLPASYLFSVFFISCCWIVFLVHWILFRLPNLFKMKSFWETELFSLEEERLASISDISILQIFSRIESLQQRFPITSGSLSSSHIIGYIMRRENFLLALLHSSVLDRFISPAFHSLAKSIAQHRILGSEAAIFSLQLTVFGFVFRGNLPLLRTFHFDCIAHTAKRLSFRLRFFSIIFTLIIPLGVVWHIIRAVARHGASLYYDMSRLKGRQWTVWSKYSLRDFSELPHLLEQRLSACSHAANKYISCFSHPAVHAFSKFASFAIGIMTCVLGIVALFIPKDQALLHFQLFPGVPFFWCLGFSGAMWSFVKSSSSDECNQPARSPKEIFTEVTMHAHYLPLEWQGKEESISTCNSFCRMYSTIGESLLQEIFGVITVPLLLWRLSAREVCKEILDFFREEAIFVSGVGCVSKQSWLREEIFSAASVHTGEPGFILPQQLHCNKKNSHLPSSAHFLYLQQNSKCCPSSEESSISGKYRDIFLDSIV